MNTLKVTAVLKSGFSAQHDWALSLDGIVAYQLRQEQLGVDAFNESHGIIEMQTIVGDLPICKEVFGDNWWYQCSRPFFYGLGTHTKHIHRRFNAFEAERYFEGRQKVVQTTKGPYKNARLSQQVFITDRIFWYVNTENEPDLIRLIEKTTHIGAKRAAGMGAVRRWEFEAHDNSDDARLLRPTPVDFAKTHDLNGLPMRWPIRPPSRHPDNQFNCIIPENIKT